MKKLALLLLALLLALPFAAMGETAEGGDPLLFGDPSVVGSLVLFGRYEQDNDAGNGAEAIQWIVLANDGENVTLLSRNGLDAKPYQEDGSDSTWETCSLRAWLNEDFLNAAFSEEEQARLVAVTVPADANPNRDTDPGNDTEDRVYLMSVDEINNHELSSNLTFCDMSYYARPIAMEHRAMPGRNGGFDWWLRTPGSDPTQAAIVSNYGITFNDGTSVSLYNAVRPVIVVKLQ